MLQVMQQGQKTSKKWVDYSDDSEDQFNSDEEKQTNGQKHSANQGGNSTTVTVDHRSGLFVQQQIARYKQARQNSQQIWILLESDDQTFLDKKIRELKENQNKDVINIYKSRDVSGAWDIRIKETAVTVWITDGIDRQKNIKVTVAERNFTNNRQRGDRDRPRGDRGDRGNDRGDRGNRGGDRGDRRGRRGGGRGGRDRNDRGDRNHGDGDRRRNRDHNNQPEKKKVYVDKATGQAPSNKQECEQKVMQEKERHYTKQEAEKVGSELGNFRNKPKAQQKVQITFESTIKPIIRTEHKNESNKPKDEPKVWLRRQREQIKEEQKEEKQDRDRKDRPVYENIKRSYEPQAKEKKIEYRQKAAQIKAEDKSHQPESVPEKMKQKKHYVRVDNLTEQQKEKLKIKKPVQKTKDLLSQDESN